MVKTMQTEITYQIDDEDIPAEIAQKLEQFDSEVTEELDQILSSARDLNIFNEEKDGEFIFSDTLNDIMQSRDQLRSKLGKLDSYIVVLQGYLNLLRQKTDAEQQAQKDILSQPQPQEQQRQPQPQAQEQQQSFDEKNLQDFNNEKLNQYLKEMYDSESDQAEQKE